AGEAGHSPDRLVANPAAGEAGHSPDPLVANPAAGEASHSPTGLVAANWRFHRAVHHASGSPRILALIRQTVGVVPTNFFDVFPDQEQHTTADHDEIVAALARRDAAAARAAAERHVTEAGQALARFLEEVAGR